MNRKMIASVVTALGLAVVIGYVDIRSRIAPATAHEFDHASWPARCQEIKQELSQQPELNLTYQPRPEKVNIQSSWSLNWFGKRVPIPAIPYSEVSVIKNSDQSYVIFMTGQLDEKPVKILLGRHEDVAPIEDMFATEGGLLNEESENQDNPTTSEEGKALTQKLFGGSVEVFQLIDLGYRHTPAELSCAGERWEQEVPILMALIVKGIGIEAQTSAIYEMDRGQVVQSQRDDQDIWVVRWDEGAFVSDMMVRLPKAHPYGTLGLGVGQEDWSVAAGQPQWLSALETALAQPNRNNWQSLVTALKQAGMSEKSINSVQAILESTTK